MSRFFSPAKLLHSLILLQLDLDGDLHGYALAASIEQKYNWKPSQTAIYNTLKQLEGENAVSVEEKIETGRVQKVYSITDKGNKLLTTEKDKIQTQMLKRLSHMVLFMQNLSDTEDLQELEKVQMSMKSILGDLAQISHLTFSLIKIRPKDVRKIIQNTITSLNHLATDNKININDMRLKFANTNDNGC